MFALRDINFCQLLKTNGTTCLLCLYVVFEDNGPHYHNTGFSVYLSEVNQAFNLTLVEYNNFEAGEGKTVLDTHFAHISHKIVRWVRVGNNLGNS